MPEAFGSVVVRAPQKYRQDILRCEEGEVLLSSLEALFVYAGIGNPKKSHPMLQWVGEQLHDEGKEEKNGFVCITIFGDDWIYIMEALIKQGKGVEIYGVIDHEYGSRVYGALNSEGDSYFETVDYEGGVNTENEPTIKNTWKNNISPDALDTFPDAFDIAD